MAKTPLSDIATFVTIVELGSLRAAANALGVKPPAISYRLNRLEEEVGVSLLLRSTRSIELTDAGRRLFQRSNPALHQISDALSDARRTGEIPSGTLRIALSHVAFRYTLADCLAEFHALYPEIELDLSFDDALVDLAEGGFHAGVRIGNLLEQSMIAVKLTGPRRIVHVASPGYLERNGRPSKPVDLLDHECIRFRFGTTKRTLQWKFQDANGVTSIEVGGSVIVNNTTAQIDAARLGLGIAWFGEKIVEREIRNGELEIILSDYVVDGQPFFLYFPREYAQLKILRVLIDFLKS